MLLGLPLHAGGGLGPSSTKIKKISGSLFSSNTQPLLSKGFFASFFQSTTHTLFPNQSPLQHHHNGQGKFVSVWCNPTIAPNGSYHERPFTQPWFNSKLICIYTGQVRPSRLRQHPLPVRAARFRSMCRPHQRGDAKVQHRRQIRHRLPPRRLRGQQLPQHAQRAAEEAQLQHAGR